LVRVDERNNLSTNTHWFSHCIRKFIWCDINDLAKDFVRKPGVVTKRLSHLGDILIFRDRVRFAVILCLDRGESFAVLFHQLAQARQQLSSVRGGKIFPRWII
jgi:hypothetical protein